MADTDTETLPNGNATLTEEEEERLKQRPADIDAVSAMASSFLSSFSAQNE